ncbi:MAG: methyl-accepting chemotaxis protein [Eubacteriales bacterium]
MNIKTKQKLLISVIIMITFFSVIINGIVFFQFQNTINHTILTSNKNLSLQLINIQYPGDWAIHNGDLYKGDVMMSGVSNRLDEIKRNSNIEVTIFQEDQRIATTIIENNQRKVGTKLEDMKIVDQVLYNEEEYMGTAKLFGENYQTIYSPIQNRDGQVIGMFFIGVEKSVINKEFIGVIYIIMLVTCILILFVIIYFNIFFNKTIKSPIDNLKEHLNILAQGNFCRSVDENYSARKDEFGEMMRSLEDTQQSLKNIIGQMKKDFKSIYKESENLSAVSEGIADASENVVFSIQQVAKANDMQVQDLNEIVKGIEDFGNSLDDMVVHIKHISDGAVKIDEMATYSNNDISTLLNSSEEGKVMIGEFEQKIKGLMETMKKINDITKLIKSISDQTNLLALNAAIEASRAGEAGKGFTVVADEIRKLAEESNKSSDDINRLIQGITHESEDMIDTSGNLITNSNNQMNIIQKTSQSYHVIMDAINNIIPKTKDIYDNARAIEVEKDKITHKIQEISTVAEQVSASSQEITASSQEVSASNEEITTTAQNLTEIIEQLVQKTDQLKTE